MPPKYILYLLINSLKGTQFCVISWLQDISYFSVVLVLNRADGLLYLRRCTLLLRRSRMSWRIFNTLDHAGQLESEKTLTFILHKEHKHSDINHQIQAFHLFTLSWWNIFHYHYYYIHFYQFVTIMTTYTILL